MSSFETYTDSYIFSSDPAVGATVLSDLGNHFSVVLDNEIRVPKSALKCTVEAVAATVTYTTPNIEARLNNNLFRIRHGGPLSTFKDILIPDGLYALTDLAATLSRLFVNEGWPDDLITFGTDNATQRVIITFNYAGTQIDFQPANSVNTILGFNNIEYPLLVVSVAGEFFRGENQAAFNSLSRYLISCDLVDGGIPTNSVGQSIITSVPITTQDIPGSTINYSPNFPISVDARGLIGNPRSQITLRLLDQNGLDVDAFGETWAIQIVIRWDIPVQTSNRFNQKPLNHF